MARRHGSAGRLWLALLLYARLMFGLKGRRAHLVGQGRVNFLVTEPQGTGAEADELAE